jgi:hypothetical protein
MPSDMISRRRTPAESSIEPERVILLMDLSPAWASPHEVPEVPEGNGASVLSYPAEGGSAFD